MNRYRFIAVVAASLLLTFMLQAEPARIAVQVDKPGHKIAPTLWGIFFEDINLSADGGIYPELVRNRSFEDADQPEYWQLIEKGGKSSMAIDTSVPLNPVNKKSLRLEVDGTATIGNDGYWGMNFVKGDSYRVQVSARAENFKGTLTVVLKSADGVDLAKHEYSGLDKSWKPFSCSLSPTAGDVKGKLAIIAAGSGSVWLDMVSVLPVKTWKNNGLRPDLCEMLAGLKPAFMRFPGGCWVEGQDRARMYNWKKTIGDVAVRIPLFNIWGYYATHGLGYHEYLQLSEDLGAEPLFCINVGMSHGEVVPMNEMGPWVQDALDAIEYANGPVSSAWGALRAKNGHPAPFNMKYMEIGNENGGPAYHERWELLYNAIKAKYPNMNLIANVWGGYPTKQIPEIIDEHYYTSPDSFLDMASKYDAYDRKGPKVFVGEYAVTVGCGQGNMRGAVGEAAFMTGIERNSDIVTMASYAPLFVNMNHRRWNPDLINFDSSRVYGLPSYYVQQMFSVHRGDVVLPLDVAAPQTDSSVRGAIGVGTWLTKAEFKDITVTRGGTTLYASDFTKEGTNGWRLLGGDWKAQDGVLRQNAEGENIRAVLGDKKWNDYTLRLKARKLSGREGFLVMFGVRSDGTKAWWNIGGWGNSRHAVEMPGAGNASVDGRIENDRWYDIKVELKGGNVKCYLDNKLLHDVTMKPVSSIYACASREEKSGEVIIKVVNAADDAQDAEIACKGVVSVAGATAIVLASETSEDENSLENPTKVSPKTQQVNVTSPVFRHTFPGNSVTVLRLKAK